MPLKQDIFIHQETLFHTCSELISPSLRQPPKYLLEQIEGPVQDKYNNFKAMQHKAFFFFFLNSLIAGKAK